MQQFVMVRLVKIYLYQTYTRVVLPTLFKKLPEAIDRNLFLCLFLIPPFVKKGLKQEYFLILMADP